MSAADKLRALGEAQPDAIRWVKQGELISMARLWNALPEIIAVVKAAESIAHYAPECKKALGALSAALTSTTRPDESGGHQMTHLSGAHFESDESEVVEIKEDVFDIPFTWSDLLKMEDIGTHLLRLHADGAPFLLGKVLLGREMARERRGA